MFRVQRNESRQHRRTNERTNERDRRNRAVEFFRSRILAAACSYWHLHRTQSRSANTWKLKGQRNHREGCLYIFGLFEMDRDGYPRHSVTLFENRVTYLRTDARARNKLSFHSSLETHWRNRALLEQRTNAPAELHVYVTGDLRRFSAVLSPRGQRFIRLREEGEANERTNRVGVKRKQSRTRGEQYTRN